MTENSVNELGYDYSEFEEEKPQPTDTDILQLSKLVKLQAELEAKVAEITQALQTAQDELRSVREKDLPELLDKLQVSRFETNNGLEVVLSEKVTASISKDRSDQAMGWLRKNGHGRLIDRVVSVKFTVGHDEEAEKLRKELQAKELEVDDKSSVHASRLSAFVREQLQKGTDLPLPLFGVSRLRYTDVKVAKVKKPRKQTK